MSELAARPGWEIVYFVFPGCDGKCAHCWSAETFLGRVIPLSAHQAFWSRVSGAKVSTVKLTGGEPFLYKALPQLASMIREGLGPKTRIIVHTSGRTLVSTVRGEDGVEQTVERILQCGFPLGNLEIHMSADEFHAAAWHARAQKSGLRTDEAPYERLAVAAENFLNAAKRIRAQTPSFNGMLKVHTRRGRLEWHRRHLFSWMSEYEWLAHVDSSEGLVNAGSAERNAIGELSIRGGTNESLFLFPGATFSTRRTSLVSDEYTDENGAKFFLNPAVRDDAAGAFIRGWWNLLNRRYVGGSLDDALSLIGKP